MNRILNHSINIYEYKPIKAHGYIKLPDWINNKKATINIQNKDDKCFVYCLARRFDKNPEKHHLERISKHILDVCSKLNFDKIKSPVNIEDIPKIEKDFEITINVCGHGENEGIYPIKINGKVIDESKHIDLLITNEDDNSHYVWITDFDKLCYTQTKCYNNKYFCKNCIQCFPTKEILERHKPDCLILNGCQAVSMPE